MTLVVVAGALANKPGNGGEAWVRATWVAGLRRLGLDLRFIEELSPDAWGRRAEECVDWFQSVTDWFGLRDRSVLIDADTGEPLAGTSVVNGADLLVNISGQLRNPAILERCERRAYVDLDPGYTQLWHEQGADLGLADHDSHFTVGLAVGRDSCSIPTGGFDWHPVMPPVLLEEWAPVPGTDLERFTTVAGWRGGYGTIAHDGESYGPKAHEFRQFLDLPERIETPIELALAIHAADDADRRSLLAHGWRLIDVDGAAGTPERFRDFVCGSSAELSVAQPIYVHARTGWFSDRTAHYLAAGRPTLVQDTGTGLVSDDGFVTFSTMEEAVAAAGDLCDRYSEHRDAARAFAEEHLDAEVVLSRFLEQTGLG